MDEISDDSEKLTPTVKLTLIQTAVRSINDLRIVETLDKFQSSTHGHGSSTVLSYQIYYDLLINACVRYDKTKKANIGKRGNVYNSTVEPTYVDYTQDASNFVQESPYGGIDIPSDEFYQIHALSSRHPSRSQPGSPSKPPFRPILNNQDPKNPSKGMVALSICDRTLDIFTFIPFLTRHSIGESNVSLIMLLILYH